MAAFTPVKTSTLFLIIKSFKILHGVAPIISVKIMTPSPELFFLIFCEIAIFFLSISSVGLIEIQSNREIFY
jgi:hypothetical protein